MILEFKINENELICGKFCGFKMFCLFLIVDMIL